ncbi:predicted Zn-dependent Hydrolase of the beta-lactamase fold [Hahella chejuensis KCTC 2396]|uniref:Predicted Zn-dependent Hydrolase of the beta-lactamase fold n=1 Tax=Hahella chejuensis (strain KCTC 2396) TaxID=349521 RepID=Q2SNU6_HAHCH|nr:MBL fold metallo-hydrolase [Hahella chejuensis]ABC27678.1 predicted Zn-dependent Hydrolase of the beta-lactamase fold [Hahella chejuensis KCTC 2396]
MTKILDLDVPHAYRNRPHHVGGRFRSPPGGHHDGRHSSEMAKVLWELFRHGNDPVRATHDHCLLRDAAKAELAAAQAQQSLTWLGQSCFYLRLGDQAILTDPFLGERASPLRFSGPKRLVASPLQIEDLHIDVIVMSHNHYDHFDASTLARVKNKESVQVVTTLGLRPDFIRLGYPKIVELDWYQSCRIQGVHYTALPAYHFSGRSLWDADQTLWASFAIEGGGVKCFFAGDTGYGDEFKRIGELTGPYDIALVPIGAYAPREVFAGVHASPEEAISMGRDLKAARLVGMHWGTVRLTTEPFWEPRDRFLVPGSGPQRRVMKIGETRDISVL